MIYCDACKQLIDDTKDAVLTFRSLTEKGEAYYDRFRITHKGRCDDPSQDMSYELVDMLEAPAGLKAVFTDMLVCSRSISDWAKLCGRLYAVCGDGGDIDCRLIVFLFSELGASNFREYNLKIEQMDERINDIKTGVETIARHTRTPPSEILAALVGTAIHRDDMTNILMEIDTAEAPEAAFLSVQKGTDD